MIEPLAVTISDAARLIGCGRSKFYQLVQSKQIKILKLGRKSVVPLASLRAFLTAKSEEEA